MTIYMTQNVSYKNSNFHSNFDSKKKDCYGGAHDHKCSVGDVLGLSKWGYLGLSQKFIMQFRGFAIKQWWQAKS